jgi:hypothetical protein
VEVVEEEEHVEGEGGELTEKKPSMVDVRSASSGSARTSHWSDWSRAGEGWALVRQAEEEGGGRHRTDREKNIFKGTLVCTVS